MPTINGLSAGGTVVPANIELPGWDTSSAVPKTRKWTLATLLGGLTTPNFTTLRIATGATVSRLLRGTGDVTVTSLASNAEATATVTLAGVAAGDHVIANPTAAPDAGLTFIAWASAADTISVKVRNHTGSPVTATTPFLFLAVRSA